MNICFTSTGHWVFKHLKSFTVWPNLPSKFLARVFLSEAKGHFLSFLVFQSDWAGRPEIQARKWWVYRVLMYCICPMLTIPTQIELGASDVCAHKGHMTCAAASFIQSISKTGTEKKKKKIHPSNIRVSHGCKASCWSWDCHSLVNTLNIGGLHHVQPP